MDRRLQQFLAVAETGNLSRAAEMLKVSQPTISVNLRKLEEDHGVAFFERSSRGVVLTAFGTILFDHVRAMDRLENHARAEIRALRSKTEHGLRIGCGFAWWPFLLRDVVDGFRHDNPGRSILVDISNSLDGLRKILAGDIALFLGTEVKNLKPELAVRFNPLFQARHAVFAREFHPVAGQTCSRADLDRFERMDVVPVETSHLAIVDPAHSVKTGDLASLPRAVLSSNSMSVCIDLLKNSNATLGYPRTLEGYFAQHRIFPLDLEDGDGSETIGLYHLEEKAQAPLFRSLTTRIENALDEKKGRSGWIDVFR